MMMMVMTTRMIAATRHRGGNRGIVIIVVIVVVLLTIQRFVLWSSIIIASGVLLRLSVVGIVLRLLVHFLPLPALHPSLLQEPTFLCQTLALFPVFDLILPYQCLWWSTEYVFILAELADPGGVRWVVEILIFLFDTAFPCRIGV